MNKKHSFILAILLTLTIINTIYLFNSSSAESQLELVKISKIIDGDTIELDDGRRIRLLNINSPEKSSALHAGSKEYLEQFQNNNIYLDYAGKEKYGRDLARIYDLDSNYINLELVKNGLASKFLVSEGELNEFSEAEAQALAEGMGIWIHSDFYGCIESNIDRDEEKVILSSKCGSLNLEGWTLKDESRKEYKFHISNFSEIILFSKEGEDNQYYIFWNQKTNVWNSDRDTLYIFDEESKIVLAQSYGY